MKKTTAIVVLKNHCVYLGERLKLTDNYGKLSHAGGKCEENEDVATCACRELWEEMGLATIPQDLTPLGQLELENPDFGKYTTWGFLIALTPRQHPINAEPAKNKAWAAIPIKEALQLPEGCLLPGTKEFLRRAVDRSQNTP